MHISGPLRLALSFALTLMTFSVVVAQPKDASGAGGGFSVTPLYQSDSALSSGGNAGYAGLLVSLRRSWSLDGVSTLGLGLNYGHADWSFDHPRSFGGVAPWNQIDWLGVSVPYAYKADHGWALGLTPTVEYSGETGARFADALEYGVLVSGVKTMNSNLTLGIGVGVYQRIKEIKAFPVLIVNWRITDRWRLSNPLPAGPSGPAGLELSYTFGSGWEAGIGGAYRSRRFRLDSSGMVPGGLGEHSYLPILARVGRRLPYGLNLSLYAGATFNSQLRVEDQDGVRRYREDLDPSLLIGLSLGGRF